MTPHPTLAPPHLRRLALATLAAAVLLAAAPAAEAERACSESNPLMRCPLAVCIALQNDVNSICKPKPPRCYNISGCFNLRQTRQKFLDCYVARSRINVTCWGGGDPGHQAEAADAIQQVYVCEARMREPAPVGCADPCPWDSSPLLAEDAVALATPADGGAAGGAPDEAIAWILAQADAAEGDAR